MATNPFREGEERSTTGGLAAWLLRNADPGSDPNAGNVHRLPIDGPIGREAPSLGGINSGLSERVGRRAVLALFGLTTVLAGVFLFLWITGDPATWLSQVEEVATAQPAPVRSEPPTAQPRADQAAAAPPLAVGVSPAGAPAPAATPRLAEAPTAGPPPRPIEPAEPLPERLTLATDEIRALFSRGEALLAAGDAAAARPLLERAALAGDATAALRLGQSYDPGYLANAGLRETAGNLGLAIFWYRRGQELGNGTAAFLARKLETAARAEWRAISARPPAWRP
jgi:hypothetical protein